jgi:predicted metal-dependent phosphoesterase TrpH
MHTSVSNDAEYTPEELMLLCYEKGLETVAITDHNSTRAYPRAQKIAQELGLNLIPAVELDCHIHGTNLHIIGYNIDPLHPVFSRYEKYVLRQSQKASMTRLKAIRSLGIVVDEEKIQALAIDGIITGEMIAEVALQDNNDQHHLLLPYREGGIRSDNPEVNFYWDLCAQGKPAYVPIHYWALTQAIMAIHEAGGFAILAHPGINIGKNEELFREIVGSGICGVEAYSSYHDPDTIHFYSEQAKKLNILLTIGSDFHGKTKPAVHLGAFRILEEQKIYAAFMRHVSIINRSCY